MDWEEEAATGSWHRKAVGPSDGQSKPFLWSRLQQIAWKWKWKTPLPPPMHTHSSPGVKIFRRLSLHRCGGGEVWEHLHKDATYVVRLTPGVKGLVHLCWTWDGYHSAEGLSKDIAHSASRPGGRQRTVSAYATSFAESILRARLLQPNPKCFIKAFLLSGFSRRVLTYTTKIYFRKISFWQYLVCSNKGPKCYI